MKKRLVFVAVGAIIVALVAIFVAEYTFLEPILFGHYETYLKSTILYDKIPEEQWIQMYSNHTSVKDFVEKFENHTIHQEITYGKKEIIYEHMDRGITTQLTIQVTPNLEFITFDCADEEGFGWSTPMEMQINCNTCMDNKDEEGFGWSIPIKRVILMAELDCQVLLQKWGQ